MTITDYNDNWPVEFQKIKIILEKNLSKILKIEHVGSTSIIGMCAKPIIDIVIIIDKDDDFIIAKNELENIGYYHNGNQDIPGREVFKRKNNINDCVLDKITHHLYVCNRENEQLKKFIFFTDYLNKNEEVMKEYFSIKKEIIGETGNYDRKKYQEIKESEKYKNYFDSIFNKMAD